MYGRAGRLTAKNGGFRPGQSVAEKIFEDDSDDDDDGLTTAAASAKFSGDEVGAANARKIKAMDARLVAVERQLTRGLEDLRAENAALASGVTRMSQQLDQVVKALDGLAKPG